MEKNVPSPSYDFLKSRYTVYAKTSLNKFLQICFRDLRIFTDFMAQKSKNDRHFWTVWPIKISKSERNKSVDIYKGSYKPLNQVFGTFVWVVLSRMYIESILSQFYDFANLDFQIL